MYTRPGANEMTEIVSLTTGQFGKRNILEMKKNIGETGSSALGCDGTEQCSWMGRMRRGENHGWAAIYFSRCIISRRRIPPYLQCILRILFYSTIPECIMIADSGVAELYV